MVSWERATEVQIKKVVSSSRHMSKEGLPEFPVSLAVGSEGSQK